MSIEPLVCPSRKLRLKGSVCDVPGRNILIQSLELPGAPENVKVTVPPGKTVRGDTTMYTSPIGPGPLPGTLW